jgi:hypothetical protein
MVSVA